MTVKDILNRKGNQVYSIDPHESVYDAIKKMTDLEIGALVVVKGDTIYGMISERDYTSKVILKGRASASTPVKDIMSKQVFCVSSNDNVHTCMKIMTDKKIRHLPVLEKGSLAGLISIGDVVKTVIDQQKVEIHTLREYIAGSYPG